MKIYRQGDILFKQVEAIPKGGKVRKSGHILEGEKTGHIHRVLELDQAEVFECGETLYLRVSESGVSIVHPEHGPITLPPGDFEVTRQRQYFPDQIRNIED